MNIVHCLIMSVCLFFGVSLHAEDNITAPLINRLATEPDAVGYKIQAVWTLVNGHPEPGKTIYMEDSLHIVKEDAYITTDGNQTGVSKCAIWNIGGKDLSFDPNKLVKSNENKNSIVAVYPKEIVTLRPGERTTVWIQSHIYSSHN